MVRPALFLDRDGVINKDFGYVHKIEDVEFLPGIFELVELANKYKYWVVVITNQAGIGRGYYSENQFLMLMDWMAQKFETNNARIDKIYYCPFHPSHGVGKYKKSSYFRKPNPGMLVKAKLELNIDMANSIFIGDSKTDMQAGLRANVGRLLYIGLDPVNESCHKIECIKDAINYLEWPVEQTKAT